MKLKKIGMVVHEVSEREKEREEIGTVISKLYESHLKEKTL